jgi:hypothetical protein
MLLPVASDTFTWKKMDTLANAGGAVSEQLYEVFSRGLGMKVQASRTGADAGAGGATLARDAGLIDRTTARRATASRKRTRGAPRGRPYPRRNRSLAPMLRPESPHMQKIVAVIAFSRKKVTN